MTDPQLPPPSPNGSMPPAPGSHVPPGYGAAPTSGDVPPVPSAPGNYAPTPPTYQAPTYQAPPGAYPAPVGGYSAPAGAYQPSAPPQPRSSALGLVSFALSIVAAVVASIIGAAAAYQIGFRLPTVMQEVNDSSDLSFLSPVRDQVLMGEVSFWVGTLAGIAAIVLGIMAIAKRAGRAWGITALVLGVIGPVIFFTVVGVTLGVGASAGAVTYYGA